MIKSELSNIEIKNNMDTIEIKRKGEERGFEVSQQDFINHCNQWKDKILKQLGGCKNLPKKLDDEAFLTIKGFDELLENYFTYKFFVSVYDWELSEEMEEIENFIADLMQLSNLK